jgi:predicted N-formylglutamate amidohydrolase
MAGFCRPWHVGVLWNRDDRIAGPLIRALGEDGDLCVGDNQPYSGRDEHGFTIPHHAEPRDLPNVLLEIRQDLIGEPGGCRAWAERLYRVFTPLLARLEA